MRDPTSVIAGYRNGGARCVEGVYLVTFSGIGAKSEALTYEVNRCQSSTVRVAAMNPL